VRLNRREQGVLFGLIVNSLPQAARGNIFGDRTLCEKFGIKPEFWLPLDPETGVETNSLHSALRAAVSGRKSAMVKLRDGRRVRAKIVAKKGGQATLQFGKRGFAFSDVDLMSLDKRVRLNALKRVFAARPLAIEEEDRWRGVGADRALSDREFVELVTHLDSTPEAVGEQLVKPHNLDSERLMPANPGYYFRLVGRLGSSTSLSGYMANELAVARKALLERHPERAVRRAGFLAFWQPLIPFELLATIGVSDVSMLLQAEDPFSLLCGFELCCNRPKKNRAVAQLGASLLTKLLLDTKSSRARCDIFSACAIISTTNIRFAAKAANAPLFWTRLAALAHAGVLTDGLRGLTDTKGFLQWCVQNWLSNYLWHSVIDRRDAPGWNPEWISPDQLYAELVGRAQNALQAVPEGSRPASWVSAIDRALTQLRQSGTLLSAYFPGPFDDFRDIARLSCGIPAFREIETKLETASSFAQVPELFALANASKPSESVVASVIRLLSGPIDKAFSGAGTELPTLRVCAQLAASGRSSGIAESVINRCIFLLRRREPVEVPSDLFMVAVHACAAHSAPEEHRKMLEDTAVKFSFAIEKVEDLSNFDLILRLLSMRDERLAPAVVRARAIARTKMGRD
jgi:hypothetical protein